jgi:hypothetical protein
VIEQLGLWPLLCRFSAGGNDDLSVAILIYRDFARFRFAKEKLARGPGITGQSSL